MATTPTTEDAIGRAQRVLDARIDAVRQAVEARQHVTDVRDDAARQRAQLEGQIAQRVDEAQRADLKAYNAALRAGWSADELRKIGLAEPQKKARARRRAARKTADTRAASPAGEAARVGDGPAA